MFDRTVLTSLAKRSVCDWTAPHGLEPTETSCRTFREREPMHTLRHYIWPLSSINPGVCRAPRYNCTHHPKTTTKLLDFLASWFYSFSITLPLFNFAMPPLSTIFALTGFFDRWILENRDEGCTESAVDGACWNGHEATVRWLMCDLGQSGSGRAFDYAASAGRLKVKLYISLFSQLACAALYYPIFLSRDNRYVRRKLV